MSLPRQAVDDRVMAHSTAISQFTADGLTDRCGCEERTTDNGDRWFLCRYHDGMNDGLAMASEEPQ